jgi:hypothetical protein
MDYSKGLEFLYINNEDENDLCKKWVHSLFSPILIANTKEIRGTEFKQVTVEIPPVAINSKFELMIISGFNFIFLDQYDILLAKDPINQNIPNCYFGLSSRLGEFAIDETKITINKLYDENKIEEKIFSFEKWFINNETKMISTSIIYGKEHDNFINKNENATIGSCRPNEDYEYWGCPFDQMSLDENIVNLTDKNNKTYKIYFSTENYNITFPQDFSSLFFNNLTEGQCQNYSHKSENEDYYVSCKNLLENKEYIPLKLISKNMTITIEIDSQKRFNNNKQKNRTNIRYEKVDYFILPLIMFKRFYVQFDAKNDTIKFYTEEKDILEVPKEKEDIKPKNNSSNAGMTFLIIFLIILGIALLFGLFWFIRKRKGSVEKNINKYNKFEEDDNFQNLNEQKRVF